MNDNILDVKNLKISFWTNNGTVKAVRDISFELKRGETLAIVGESGSGKSVTSKAILGILAGNAIIEGGEILFDGKDLLRITEDDMYKIRGDKISMIFQDPLSSLDPIVKIGKQITEALILKNRDSRKNARIEFNNKLELLKLNMIEAVGEERKAEIEQYCEEFDNFNIKALELENAYNESSNASLELISDLKDFLFKAERKQKLNVPALLSDYNKKLLTITDLYFTHNYRAELDLASNKLVDLIKHEKEHAKDGSQDEYTVLEEQTITTITELISLLEKASAALKPNFFRYGYYLLKNPDAKLYQEDVKATNEMTLEYLDNNFMLEFIKLATSGLKNAYSKAFEGKKEVIKFVDNFVEYLNGKTEFDRKDTVAQLADLHELMERAINRLEIVKDSTVYTFELALKNEVNKLFANEKNNVKEENRFARQTARHDALVAKGKKIDWKVVPKNIIPLETSVNNILNILLRVKDRFENALANKDSLDFDKLAIELIDHFKELASIVVYEVTDKIAKETAIKLMEEVGIPEPRIRYYQYPFEFSGGMRQRIVIAIALAANPDILICDEPTTALDVTIQSQILELINKLKKERNLSIIFITHDLGVVANMADRIAVMYAGKIVEYGDSNEIFYDPRHPYTWALLSSMPDLDTKEKLEAIPGTPPNMIYPPVGDAFAARNKYALRIDFEKQPPLFKVSDTHYAATWLMHKDAPKVEMPSIISKRIERMKAKDGKKDEQ